MPTDIVMDAGTYKTTLFSNGKTVLRQPSAALVDAETWVPIAFGEKAKAMLGRTSENYTTVFPLERGVVSDYDIMEQMVVHYIRTAFGNKIVKPRVIVIAPSGVTTVQHHSLANAVSAAGCRNISTVENTIAAAVGLGFDLTKPHGNMVVDIGGGTVDVATMSMGGIACNDVLRVGSIDFDDAIEKYVRLEKNILIGSQTAEYIKKTVGGAIGRDFSVTVTAKGRHAFSGLPQVFEISSGEVSEAINDHLHTILNGCRAVLEKTDPDIVSDISRDGLYLIGDGAKLFGMCEKLEKYLEVKVNFSPDYDNCVLRGAEAILKNPKIIQNSDYQYRAIKNLIVEQES